MGFSPRDEYEYDNLLDSIQGTVALLSLPASTIKFLMANVGSPRIRRVCAEVHTAYPESDWHLFRDQVALRLYPHSRTWRQLQLSLEKHEQITDTQELVNKMEEVLERLHLLSRRWGKEFPYSKEALKTLLASKVSPKLRDRVLSGGWRLMSYSQFIEHILTVEADMVEADQIEHPPKPINVFEDTKSKKRVGMVTVGMQVKGEDKNKDDGKDKEVIEISDDDPVDPDDPDDDVVVVRAIRRRPLPPEMPPPPAGKAHKGIQARIPRYRQCFNCGSFDHIASGCDQEPVQCDICATAPGTWQSSVSATTPTESGKQSSRFAKTRRISRSMPATRSRGERTRRWRCCRSRRRCGPWPQNEPRSGGWRGDRGTKRIKVVMGAPEAQGSLGAQEVRDQGATEVKGRVEAKDRVPGTKVTARRRKQRQDHHIPRSPGPAPQPEAALEYAGIDPGPTVEPAGISLRFPMKSCGFPTE